MVRLILMQRGDRTRMARFTADFPDSFEKQLAALERAGKDAAIKKMLVAGSEPIEKEMKQQCQNHKQSRRMVESIKTTSPKKNEKGYFTVTRPTGKETRQGKNGRTHTVRNMEKLAYLHYGTTKQPATGIVTKIVNRSQKQAIEAVQRAYNREVET